jgi:uncharacterized protein (DUF736 family)
MATIGPFTKSENGFSGLIKTAAPAPSGRSRSTSRRASSRSNPLRTRRRRTCACWQPTMSRLVQRGSGPQNIAYHSVKLNDPSFLAPFYTNLVDVEGSHALVWSR